MQKTIKILLCASLIGLLAGMQVQAQTFDFEADFAGWTAQQGTLSLSTEHYKEGTHSLCWSTSGKSTLLVTGFTAYTAGSSNSTFMQIYSPSKSNDTLVVEFMNGTAAKRTANYLCNYRGWREFNRTYKEYASTANSSITALRITLKPASSGERNIYFDNVQLNATTDVNRVPGCQWLLDRQYLTVNTWPLTLYANETDLPLTTPTAQELTDLQTIRTRIMPSPGYNAMQAILAKNWVNSNLTLTRNTDGSICGTPIGTTSSDLKAATLITVLERLQYLAGGKLNGNVEAGTAFDNYLDQLLDQGLAEGCNISYASNAYTDPKDIIPKVLSLVPACNNTQLEGVLGLARWISHYGMCYFSEESYLSNLVSDVVYLFLPYMEVVAAFQPDSAVAVRELHAVQRYMNRNTEYVPGGGDMLKPDGTGFHHNTHYNNYMYAYMTFMTGIYNFRNTEFQISEDAYRRFGKAITSIYTMATPGNNDNRFYANALCGRNPFDAGNHLYFSKALFANLIDAGADYPAEQQTLQSAYNYFYQVNTYTAPDTSYDGFHQFNYSPLGIFRHGNWVASMRAPTSKFWGSEIYSGANRFGRYQSHGSLEITYQGSNLLASGYPTNGTGGGWDWNVIPGTTTVHYTSWADMMPGQNTTARFDQYSNGANFAGALGMGQYGIFACNFDQTDTWGSQRFTPTNLTFKKSVFAFDSILVALGSNIAANGNYTADRITATNLFQNIVGIGSGTFTVNGTTQANGYSGTLNKTISNWMVTPCGTGYYIPKNNDVVRVSYGPQTTPKETGADYAAPTTTLTAAKAYIDHGVKTSGKNYQFVVVPNVSSSQMQAWADACNVQMPYKVEQQDENLHAVSYQNTIAYSFFSAVSDLTFGIVKASTHQHLLIDQVETATGRHHFAACNPNLEPKTDAIYGWKASETSTTLTLTGEYKPLTTVQGVTFHTPANGETLVDVNFADGEPVYFTAILMSDTHVADNTDNASITFKQMPNALLLQWYTAENGLVRIYSANGQTMVKQPMQGQNALQISTQNWPRGVYLCKIGIRTFKFVK